MSTPSLQDAPTVQAVQTESRWQPLLVCLGCLLLTLPLLVQAALQRVWYDEHLVLFVAQSPRFHQVWDTLQTYAMCTDPPLYHWLAWLSVRVIRPEEFAIRLPSLLGFLTMMVCIFVLVRRYLGTWLAASWMLTPALLLAARYGTEGRPYGFILGNAALAMVAWRLILDGKRRVGLPLLSVTLACCVLSHYFAPLVAIPFGCAELWRTWERRRIDWGVWAALIAAGCALLVYLPLLPAASAPRAYIPPHEKDWDPVAAYIFYLPLPYSLPVALLAGWWLVFALKPVRQGPVFPAAERVVYATFALLPLLAGLLVLVAGVTRPRYVISGMLGVVIGSAALFLPWFRSWPERRAKQLLAAMALTICFGTARPWLGLAPPDSLITTIEPKLPALTQYTDLPIVFGDSFHFLVSTRYGRPDLAARAVYTQDEQDEVAVLGYNHVYLAVLGIQSLAQLPIYDRTKYLAQHQQLLYPEINRGKGAPPLDSLGHRLRRDGWKLEPQGEWGEGGTLYLATRPERRR